MGRTLQCVCVYRGGGGGGIKQSRRQILLLRELVFGRERISRAASGKRLSCVAKTWATESETL